MPLVLVLVAGVASQVPLVVEVELDVAVVRVSARVAFGHRAASPARALSPGW